MIQEEEKEVKEGQLLEMRIEQRSVPIATLRKSTRNRSDEFVIVMVYQEAQ